MCFGLIEFPRGVTRRDEKNCYVPPKVLGTTQQFLQQNVAYRNSASRISISYSVILRVRVVLKRTVVGD